MLDSGITISPIGLAKEGKMRYQQPYTMVFTHFVHFASLLLAPRFMSAVKSGNLGMNVSFIYNFLLHALQL